MALPERDVSKFKCRLAEYVESITTPSKGTNKWVCPLCKSGTGPKGTGAFSIEDDGQSWTCFACGEHGDLLDLIGKFENLTTFNEQMRRAEELFGAASMQTGRPNQNRTRTDQKAKSAEPAADYSAFFLEASRHLSETDFHRGISEDTLKRFGVGFVPNWKHPKVDNPKVPTSPRLIIPTSASSYLARDTRAKLTDRQAEYAKQKVGSVHIFNAEALWKSETPVCVCEGELDAMSVVDCGCEAVALGSTSSIDRFLRMVGERRPVAPLVLCLDADDEGVAGREKLSQGLGKLGVQFSVVPDLKGCKDANEVLMKHGRQTLEALVRDAVDHVLRKAELASEAEDADREAYKKTSATEDLQQFLSDIWKVDTPFIPTGFFSLDRELDGGLNEGLYVIGAISSLGKTTYMLQMGNQIAEHGSHILYFSLEMSRMELIAKSISRHTAILSTAQGYGAKLAKTARGITTGRRWSMYGEHEKNLIFQAMDRFGGYAGNIFLHEGIGDIGVQQVREAVERHVAMTGKTPVVFVDYLQILAPMDVKMTDKQAVDRNVLELKRISRDFKLPLVAVSSFNRMSYEASVKMEAFKESGAIEYSSDVLLGMQLKGAGVKDFDATEAKAQCPRDVELVVLKNRNGAVGAKIEYSYNPMFNLFDEVGTVKPERR